MSKQKYVVVTGVSTGIGWGTTKVLIEQGGHVFGGVRNTAECGRVRVCRLTAENKTHK